MRTATRITDEALAEIASRATRQGDYFEVRSSSDDTVYFVTPQFCSCPSFRYGGGPCKHILACGLLCPPVALPFVGDAFKGF